MCPVELMKEVIKRMHMDECTVRVLRIYAIVHWGSLAHTHSNFTYSNLNFGGSTAGYNGSAGDQLIQCIH